MLAISLLLSYYLVICIALLLADELANSPYLPHLSKIAMFPVCKGGPLISSCYKQLIDEVFVISRVIKVEVGIISRRLGLKTLTEILIILGVTKTSSNNCFLIH